MPFKDDSEFDEAFSGVGYWLTIGLRDCNFGDQQTVTREAGGDETLLPQKRFMKAVESICIRKCGATQESIPTPSEDWFVALKPPAIGNVIDMAIREDWYPVASKTSDFMRGWLKQRGTSETEMKSPSTQSTQESSLTSDGDTDGLHSTPA